MKVVIGANLALRFLLGLCALAAVGYWGWQTGDGVLGLVLAVAAVIAALFVSPKHTIETSKPVAFAIELAVWLAAGAALTRPTTARLH